MIKQRGQAVVEFALVLPFFMLLLFGLLTAGFLFADYMTLSNVARSSAREAAIGESEADISSRYGNTKLLSNMYTWSSSSGFEITDVELNGSKAKKVTITTTLNTSFPGVGFMKGITGFPPDGYEINYTMHDEAGSVD